MEIIIRKKQRYLITRTKRKKGGGIVRIDEDACLAIEQLCEDVGGNISISKLTSELIKQAAKEAVIMVKEAE